MTPLATTKLSIGTPAPSRGARTISIRWNSGLSSAAPRAEVVGAPEHRRHEEEHLRRVGDEGHHVAKARADEAERHAPADAVEREKREAGRAASPAQPGLTPQAARTTRTITALWARMIRLRQTTRRTWMPIGAGIYLIAAVAAVVAAPSLSRAVIGDHSTMPTVT